MSGIPNATTIVGLEVHVQLQTDAKLFCGCSTTFGSPPNTQTCHVCIGMPGALPVLNRRALQLAIKTGLALNCEIERNTKWDRKNYFYPDLPKGYQISQFDRPICRSGHLDVIDTRKNQLLRTVRIERAHLEEDAGKSLHDESGQGDVTKVDLNRAGTPLLEIVTKPDLRSGSETRLFLAELKLILTYLGVSDCNMQKGNLRVDANVNLHIDNLGSTIETPIAEIKNLNSFRAVQRAIEFEQQRQFEAWNLTHQRMNPANKQTRGWNDTAGETYLQREKEDSADYRYFPDPDLVNIRVGEDWIESIGSEIGCLPRELRDSLIEKYQITAYDADVLVGQGQAVVDYFVAVADASSLGKQSSNWIQQEVLRHLKEHDLPIENYTVKPVQLADLLTRINQKQLDQTRAKEVLMVMAADRIDVAKAMEQLGYQTVDQATIDDLCLKLIAENPEIMLDVKAGKTKAIGALIGQARKSIPGANPNLIRETLLNLISSRS
jgi:aspartyl-tRNA(Asn)/glutamyl-tRNA(Gln) amidotransferase subunit B